MLEIVSVDEATRLQPALAEVAADVVGVDVERADSDRYFRRAALIQVGSESGCVLVDPLAIEDLDDLADFLRPRTAVLHAIENDLEPLDAAGVDLGDVADTAVAAAMLGLPTGLSTLIEEELDVTLHSDKDRYQRADWEQRPLSDGMRRYAAEDVVHLPDLWRLLRDRLEEAGRFSWYRQELEATIDHARAQTRDWRNTKSVGRLNPGQRAVLKSLWETREEVAREHDIAPNLLLHDNTLVSLAEEPADDPGSIVRRNSRPPGPLREHVERLFEAQQQGLELEPEPREESRRWSPEDRDAHDAMRRVRNRTAKEIGLDAGVLCPNRQLWDAVAASPTGPDELATAAGLRGWQQGLLADELWEAYEKARISAETD